MASYKISLLCVGPIVIYCVMSVLRGMDTRSRETVQICFASLLKETSLKGKNLLIVSF